jgi:hypothetical protein
MGSSGDVHSRRSRFRLAKLISQRQDAALNRAGVSLLSLDWQVTIQILDHSPAVTVFVGNAFPFLRSTLSVEKMRTYHEVLQV